MLLPGLGEEGQRRLLASHVVIVGCGALGCAAADLLARAGVGSLTIIDRDVVEPTNLQRQTLFTEQDAREGLPKAEAARHRLAAVNSGISVRSLVADFGPRNAENLVAFGGPSPAALILDGTDNFETRYLINDLCVKHGLPYIYGGVVGTRGMQMTVLPRRTPCLRCIFDAPPPPGSSPTCDTAGVLAAAASIVASCQAADAIKLLLGREDLVSPTLLDFDLWEGRRRRIDPGRPRPDCPCCGRKEFDFLEGKGRGETTALCGRGAVQVLPAEAGEVDLGAIARRLRPHGELRQSEHLVRLELRAEGLVLTVFRDGRAIVSGTERPEVARTMYARYIGA